MALKLNVPNYPVGHNTIPAINVSASQDASGKIHISLVNLDLHNDISIRTTLAELNWKTVKGQILTSANITDINTFEKPDKLHLAKFTGAKKEGDKLVVLIPKKSVVTLELE